MYLLMCNNHSKTEEDNRICAEHFHIIINTNPCYNCEIRVYTHSIVAKTQCNEESSVYRNRVLAQYGEVQKPQKKQEG